ncbi:M56 family metallopeptidase [Christiangramia sediminis]|uniref:M56 family metallopeptidase n=1 Tax=Christiangramia sediminis TaxID=2881336 RepID=A0A9X1RZI3_9FLAO|nr:M56 family metallopeptidase [Christiangramia sediminis]MCB7482300.1 M56 family metallopeptidase [Christiangramia sediminis]
MTYILQVLLFQLAFLLVYEIWLKKETFFNYNRWYLILAPSLAFLLPLLKLDFLSDALPAENLKNLGNINVWLPEVMIGSGNTSISENATTIAETSGSVNSWLILYASGVLLSLILLIIKFRKLQQLSAKSKIKLEHGLRIHSIPNSDIACTFFNKIFIGDQISAKEKQQIMAHELVHIHENHSLDLLFFEILKIIFWFNPLVYIFQNQLATVHEYIADQTAVKISGKKEYYHQLLNTAFSTQNISFINQFFNHSLIKKRILMLQKNNSSKLSKFKFLLVIPLMLAMLTYVSCSDVETKEDTDSSLSQYNYSLQKGEDLESDPEKNRIHKDFEDFLINNPDYVSWATIDYESDMVSYSVHKSSEKVPESYNKMIVSKKDGTEYTMYMNLKATGSNTTSSNKKYDQNSPKNWDNKAAVPYAVIEKVPAFPECDQWVDDARKNCTSSEISKFVNENFDTSLGKQLGLTGVNRVIVQFRIDETGSIVDIKARAPHPELEEEAKRVVGSMPDMIPGEQNGRPVSVMYSLPIAFQVSE